MTSKALIFFIFLGTGITLSWLFYQTSEDDMVLLDETFAAITPLRLQKSVKIAIIGSGIGGSSAAYFIRKHLGPKAEIHMYEKSNKIGGRLRVAEFDGKLFEAGGSIIHSSNKYMVRFINELGLKRNSAANVKVSSIFGIYDGKNFVFTEGENGILTKVKMIWRYGFFSLYYMSQSLGKMLQLFVNVYKIQDEVKSFRTVPEMLREIGGEKFYEYTQKTAKEVMCNNGVGKLLVDELVTGVTRCNYGQDSSVNAFTGYVSMAGAQGGSLFAVEGGNYQVPQKLVEYSNTTIFFNQNIQSIQKEKKDNNRFIYYLVENDGKKTAAYDVVIVAAPLEDPKTNLQCPHCNDWPKKFPTYHYQKTIATFVQGTLNHKYFNVDEKNLPSDVFTTESTNNIFSSIGQLTDVYGRSDHSPIYKVFSRTLLKKSELKKMFILNSSSPKNEKTVPWLAYPHYDVPEQFSPFLLDEGVFYVNAIERAASAMEMSAIGGRNAALLSRNYIDGGK